MEHEGLVVVYKTIYSASEQLLGALCGEGLNPVVIDEPDPTLLYASAWTCQVHIAVPKEEEAKAKEFLRKWDEEQEYRWDQDKEQQ